MHGSYERLSAGDIVGMTPDDGRMSVRRVWFFVNVDSTDSFAFVSKFSMLEMHASYSTWRVVDDPSIVLFDEFSQALTFSMDGDCCTVLHPLGL